MPSTSKPPSTRAGTQSTVLRQRLSRGSPSTAAGCSSPQTPRHPACLPLEAAERGHLAPGCPKVPQPPAQGEADVASAKCSSLLSDFHQLALSKQWVQPYKLQQALALAIVSDSVAMGLETHLTAPEQRSAAVHSHFLCL